MQLMFYIFTSHKVFIRLKTVIQRLNVLKFDNVSPKMLIQFMTVDKALRKRFSYQSCMKQLNLPKTIWTVKLLLSLIAKVALQQLSKKSLCPHGCKCENDHCSFIGFFDCRNLVSRNWTFPPWFRVWFWFFSQWPLPALMRSSGC